MSFNLLYFRSIGILYYIFIFFLHLLLCLLFLILRSVWVLLFVCVWFFLRFIQFSLYFQNRWKIKTKQHEQQLWITVMRFYGALQVWLLHRPLFISSSNFCCYCCILLLLLNHWIVLLCAAFFFGFSFQNLYCTIFSTLTSFMIRIHFEEKTNHLFRKTEAQMRQPKNDDFIQMNK